MHVPTISTHKLVQGNDHVGHVALAKNNWFDCYDMVTSVYTPSPLVAFLINLRVLVTSMITVQLN